MWRRSKEFKEVILRKNLRIWRFEGIDKCWDGLVIILSRNVVFWKRYFFKLWRGRKCEVELWGDVSIFKSWK